MTLFGASLSFELSAWWILGCAALGVGIALLMYFRNSFIKSPTTRQQTVFRALGVVRWTVITLLALLLLAPLFRSQFTEERKPVVVVLQDNSQSVTYGFGAGDSAAYVQALAKLQEKLGDKFDVKSYGFSQELLENLNPDFKGEITDLSRALGDVYNLYGNQTVGGIILATDGIYNQGSNPYYIAQNYPSIPVYSVALGDTTPQRDLKIDRVLYNDLVYLNDRFKVSIEMLSQNLVPANTTLEVVNMGNRNNPVVVESKSVSFTNSGEVVGADFILDAKSAGLQHYRVRLKPVSGEFTEANNYKDLFVEVLDSRQKILILANSPHPDVAAIRQAIETNKNYEVDVKFVQNMTGVILKDYNLVIMHQLPSAKYGAQSIVDEAKKNGVALWYILGSQSALQMFNGLQGAVQISGNGQSLNEAIGSLDANFSLFTTSDQFKAQLPKLPPLYVPFGQFKTSPSSRVMLRQRIGTVTTEYPLLVFEENSGNKTAVLLGEGIWRWKLYDYRLNSSHESFNELVGKTIQYLAVKQDKRQFRVKPTKNIFLETESVDFTGELYNASYELVNDPEVSVTITDGSGKEFPFQMNKTSKAYDLRAGTFPEGNYTYVARTNYNKQQLTQEGKFTISPLELESSNTVADHKLLYQISDNSGGKLYAPTQLDKLADDILAGNQAKPVLYSTYKTLPFINLKWIFAILMTLFAVEWFIRKYMGGY